jgi:hypothetical protein
VFRDAQALLFTHDGAATTLVHAGEPRLRTYRGTDSRVAPVRARVPLVRRARRLATS